VEAERQIVIAEKERRPELAVRMSEASRALFQNGLMLQNHETIGTPQTLGAATAEGCGLSTAAGTGPTAPP
jgi:hypothetical protein